MDDNDRFPKILEAMPDGILVVDSEGRILFANGRLQEMSGLTAEQLLGSTTETLVPDALRAAHTGHRATYRAAGLPTRPMGANIDTRLQRRDGSTFPVDISLSALETDRGPLIVAAVRDATERKRAHERVVAVNEVTRAILEGRDTDEVLRRIARHARELVGASVASVAIPAEGTGSLVIRVASGAGAGAMLGMTLPPDGITAKVMRTKHPLNVFQPTPDERPSRPGVPRFGPALLVPLARDQAFGTLTVANLEGGRPFTEEDTAIVQLFATHAAIALDYGRVQEKLHRLAVLEDRERIARELHDGVIQSLFALGMGLQATARQVKREEHRKRIESAVAEIDVAIRDLRRYIFGLRPGLLTSGKLEEALRGIAGDLQERTGLVTAVEVDPRVADKLPPIAGDVIQIAREALSNVGRHAQAATCRVSLRAYDGGVLMEVDDDGKGFDPATVRGRGQGLRNLRERAGSLGGSIEIMSGPARGTTLRMIIPSR